MKQSNLSFADGLMGERAASARNAGAIQRAFDFDRAAQIIKDKLKDHPDLVAEAGLQGDWAYTGGVIFENGRPTIDEYTYLSSNWATPTLILSWDGAEQEEIPCHVPNDESRFHEKSQWDKESLAILGIDL